MGCDPGVLPGYVPLDQGRARLRSALGRAAAATRGLNLLEMMDAALAGRLKALWAIGYDVLLTNPNATETAPRPAVARARHRAGHVPHRDRTRVRDGLPAGVLVVREGRHVHERRAPHSARPRGAAPARRVEARLADHLRHRARDGRPRIRFASPEEIWNEVRTLCEGARGMTYARLDEGGLQWPCPGEEHPGTPILHRDTFALRAARRAASRRVPPRPPKSSRRSIRSLLITGRSLYQFNAGTMTGRTLNNELRPSDVLDMSSVDAGRQGFGDGQMVRVTSRYGAATLSHVRQHDGAARAALRNVSVAGHFPQRAHGSTP